MPCTKGVNRARAHGHGDTIGRSKEIYHIPPSISIPIILQSISRTPSVSSPLTSHLRLAAMWRYRFGALDSSVVHTLDASMQGSKPPHACIAKPRHGLSCYTLQQRHPFFLAVVLASIAGRASRPHHVADQSVPPSSFTAAARRKLHPIPNPSRSRVADRRGARVES
jgi:hypothetical protein